MPFQWDAASGEYSYQGDTDPFSSPAGLTAASLLDDTMRRKQQDNLMEQAKAADDWLGKQYTPPTAGLVAAPPVATATVTGESSVGQPAANTATFALGGYGTAQANAGAQGAIGTATANAGAQGAIGTPDSEYAKGGPHELLPQYWDYSRGDPPIGWQPPSLGDIGASRVTVPLGAGYQVASILGSEAARRGAEALGGGQNVQQAAGLLGGFGPGLPGGIAAIRGGEGGLASGIVHSRPALPGEGDAPFPFGPRGMPEGRTTLPTAAELGEPTPARLTPAPSQPAPLNLPQNESARRQAELMTPAERAMWQSQPDRSLPGAGGPLNRAFEPQASMDANGNIIPARPRVGAEIPAEQLSPPAPAASTPPVGDVAPPPSKPAGAAPIPPEGMSDTQLRAAVENLRNREPVAPDAGRLGINRATFEQDVTDAATNAEREAFRQAGLPYNPEAGGRLLPPGRQPIDYNPTPEVMQGEGFTAKPAITAKEQADASLLSYGRTDFQAALARGDLTPASLEASRQAIVEKAPNMLSPEARAGNIRYFDDFGNLTSDGRVVLSHTLAPAEQAQAGLTGSGELSANMRAAITEGNATLSRPLTPEERAHFTDTGILPSGVEASFGSEFGANRNVGGGRTGGGGGGGGGVGKETPPPGRWDEPKPNPPGSVMQNLSDGLRAPIGLKVLGHDVLLKQAGLSIVLSPKAVLESERAKFAAFISENGAAKARANIESLPWMKSENNPLDFTPNRLYQSKYGPNIPSEMRESDAQMLGGRSAVGRLEQRIPLLTRNERFYSTGQNTLRAFRENATINGLYNNGLTLASRSEEAGPAGRSVAQIAQSGDGPLKPSFTSPAEKAWFQDQVLQGVGRTTAFRPGGLSDIEAARAGVNQFKGMQDVINHGTQYGPWKQGQWNPLFSTRAASGRAMLLTDPFFQPGSLLHASARQEAVKQVLAQITYSGAQLALASSLGATITPGTSTFGYHLPTATWKSDDGTSHSYNPWAGINGPVAAILRTGQAAKEGNFGMAVKAWAGMAESNLSPGAAFVKQGVTGTDWKGNAIPGGSPISGRNPMDWAANAGKNFGALAQNKDTYISLFAPIWAESAYKAIQQDGVLTGLLEAIPSVEAAGVNVSPPSATRQSFNEKYPGAGNELYNSYQKAPDDAFQLAKKLADMAPEGALEKAILAYKDIYAFDEAMKRITNGDFEKQRALESNLKFTTGNGTASLAKLIAVNRQRVMAGYEPN